MATQYLLLQTDHDPESERDAEEDMRDRDPLGTIVSVLGNAMRGTFMKGVGVEKDLVNVIGRVNIF